MDLSKVRGQLAEANEKIEILKDGIQNQEEEISSLRIKLLQAKDETTMLSEDRDEARKRLATAEQMANTREEIQFLNWLLANCKIIHWPGGGHYPIEHAPAANKDGVMLLKMAMNKEGMYSDSLPPAPEKQEGGAA